MWHISQQTPEILVEEKMVAPGPARRRKQRGILGMRFNIRNFRIKDGLSVRRFSIAEAAFILMLALLTSRVLGVLRQALFNALFDPSSPEVNAYIVAARLPELLFTLVSGGALIHAFVPVFLSFEKEKGEAEAWRMTSIVFNVLLVVLTVLIVVSEFLTPMFVTNILAPGSPLKTQELTTTLTRIMLMQPLLLGLGTVLSAVLNSKRQFLMPALSLAIYNIGVIGGLLVAYFIPGVGIYGPTYGTVVAVGLQMLVLIPALLKQGMRYSFSFDLRHPGLRQVVILLLPNALAVGVYSIGNIVDTNFTSFMKDQASFAALHNADMLQNLPVALIAQAVGQSLLPHLAMHAETGRYFRMRQTALKVMGTSLLLTIPAMIGLVVLGLPTIRILFQHGAFDEHAVQLTYLALVGFALGIPGTAAGNLISAGFFALKDAFTPFLLNTYALVVRWGCLYFFFTTLPDQWIILAVPLAQMVAVSTESVLLYFLLFLRLRKHIKNDPAVERLHRRRRFLRERQQDTHVLATRQQG